MASQKKQSTEAAMREIRRQLPVCRHDLRVWQPAFRGSRVSVGPIPVSTLKARWRGFHDCTDTAEMFIKWLTDYRRRWVLRASGIENANALLG